MESNGQNNNDTESFSLLNSDTSTTTTTTTPPPAAHLVDRNHGDSSIDTNVDNITINSSNTTLTSEVPRPNFSSQSEIDQGLDIHSTSTTLTSSTPHPNSSIASSSNSNYILPSSHSSLSAAKSSKLALDALVYDAIIQNDIPTLAKILSENPNYYLNLPIRTRDIGRSENDKGDNTSNDIHGDDKTPLMIAASLDYVDVVKYLLKNPSVNVDLQDEQGEAALFQAAAAGNSEVVRVLLKNCATVDLLNNQDLSPLSIAAYHGYTYVCRMLLDRGKASTNKKDNTGKTALAYAAHRGHAQTVETLLSRGANVNIADKFDWTPLMLSAYTGRANIVRRLLLFGADRSLKTTNGKTAAILARDSGFIHVADMIDNFTTQIYKSRAITMKEGDDDGDGDGVGVRLDGRISHIEKGQGLSESYNPETKRLSYRVSARSDWNQRRQYRMSEDSRKVSTSSRLRLEMVPRKKNTLWVYISWVVTAPFLDRLLIIIGGMDDARSRQAWREKVTMCFFIAMASLFIALITFGFVTLACTESPPIPNASVEKFWGENSTVSTSRVMIVRGKIYDVGDYFKLGFHRPILPGNSDNTLSPIINPLFGNDVSQFFPLDDLAIGCKYTPSNQTGTVLCPNLPQTDSRYHCHSSKNSLRTLESLFTSRFVGVSWDEIYNRTGNRKLLVFNNFVYDFTSYLDPSNTDYWLGDNGTSTKQWIQSLIGLDATKEISRMHNVDAVNCFEHFRVGKVEGIVYGCAATSTIVIVLTTITSIFGVMKLLSALAFDHFISKKITVAEKKSYDELRRIIVFIPCYSEGKEGLKMSLDSLAATDYSDQHKLFFVVADGDITGSGESRSTPDILKDLITPFDEVNRPLSTENAPRNSDGKWKESTPKSYIAIGQGTKRHNMAQVYTGYYLYENRRIPTILVIKCGTPAERKTSPKSGNRGKRDSQLVLMNLLNKAYYNETMAELEFELFEKIRLVTGGVTVDNYELMCMVDADTIVEEPSLSMLVACMERDPRVVGICGETKILNKTENWVTMIQVFEYYISHHLGKTFESVYAGVTCLPGCFSMYRIYDHNREGFRTPILLDSDLMMNYTTNEVDTFHQKNLLLLGEDRYLTTLILRAFPHRKTLYCPAAVCLTAVPTSFSVLVSQRRRWINGTVHNLLELIMASELPGRFCCSMQFVAFLDFLGTVTTPFATFYLFSLVIAVIFGKPFGLQIAYSGVTYFVQFALVIFTSFNPAIVMWFIIYALSTPIWFAILPLYAFWNFDDFTWGTTRKIEGIDNGHDEDTIFDKFDPRKVEFKRWDEWIVYRQLHNLPMLAPLPQPIRSDKKSVEVLKDKFDLEDEDESKDGFGLNNQEDERGGEVNMKDESRSTPSQMPAAEEKVENAR